MKRSLFERNIRLLPSLNRIALQQGCIQKCKCTFSLDACFIESCSFKSQQFVVAKGSFREVAEAGHAIYAHVGAHSTMPT